MKAESPNPAFILWTVNTAIDKDDSLQLDQEKQIVDYLMEQFPFTKIIPILGNSDPFSPLTGN